MGIKIIKTPASIIKRPTAIRNLPTGEKPSIQKYFIKLSLVKIQKKTIYILSVILILLLTALSVFISFRKISKKIISDAVNQLSENTSTQITYKDISFSSDKIHIKGITVTKNSSFAFYAEKLTAEFSFLNLLFEKKVPVKLEIENSKIIIDRNKIKNTKGTITQFTQRLYLKEIKIKNSTLNYIDKDNEFYFEKLNFKIKHLINKKYSVNFNAMLYGKTGKSRFSTSLQLNSEVDLASKNMEFKHNLKEISIQPYLFAESLNGSGEISYSRKHFYSKNNISNITVNKKYTDVINKLTETVFSEKFSGNIKKSSMEITVDKKYFYLLANLDNILKIKTDLNAETKTDNVNITLYNKKIESHSTLFKPKIYSELSETFNKEIKNLILIIEKNIIKVMEAL